MYLQDIKSSPSLSGQNIFHQVEFVNNNNLEAQNPRRDTSIPSVSAGLELMGLSRGNTMPSCLEERESLYYPGRMDMSTFPQSKQGIAGPLTAVFQIIFHKSTYHLGSNYMTTGQSYDQSCFVLLVRLDLPEASHREMAFCYNWREE